MVSDEVLRNYDLVELGLLVGEARVVKREGVRAWIEQGVVGLGG
jgi:hypothetical protein